MSVGEVQRGWGGPVRPVRRAVVVFALVLVAACVQAPAVPLGIDGQPDPVLDQGRQIFASQCSTCHGSAGQGGRGAKLNGGRAEDQYPEIADMAAVVSSGKGSRMPSFAEELSPSEIEAVVRYVREVLS